MDNKEVTGVRLFINLFNEKPDLKNLFRFGNLSDEDLEKSDHLKKHGSIVISAIDSVLCLLEDNHELNEVLSKLTEKHVKIPGFKEGWFWMIESPFLKTVQETMGDDYTSEQEYLFRIMIHSVLQVMNDICHLQMKEKDKKEFRS